MYVQSNKEKEKKKNYGISSKITMGRGINLQKIDSGIKYGKGEEDIIGGGEIKGEIKEGSINVRDSGIKKCCGIEY